MSRSRANKSKGKTAPEIDIREDTRKKAEEYERDIKKLWKVILRADEEKRAKIMESLDEKTIIALRTFNNPYKKPVIEGEKIKCLAFNVINFTEKYARRFATTAVIGFLYRMLDEHSPSDIEEYVSENDPVFANLYNKQVKELILNKPEEKLLADFEEIKKDIEKLKTTSDKTVLREKIKESFIIRSKIIKYHIHLVKGEREEYDKKKEAIDRIIRNKNNEIKQAGDALEIAKVRLEKRKAFEESHIKKAEKVEEKLEAKLEEKSIEIEKKEEKVEKKEEKEEDEKVGRSTFKKEVSKDMMTTKEARTRSIKSFEDEIKNHQNLLIQLEKELKEKSEESEKLVVIIAEFNIKIDGFLTKFRELKEEYNKLHKQSNKSKSKKKSDKTHPLDDVEIDKYEPSEEELDKIAESVKKELNIKETAEEHTEKIQNIIQEFMDKYFRYNPDNHVRCAYKPNYEDETRTPLKTDENGDIIEKDIERSVIPPDDTFFRLDRYIENNYEPLRQATDDIYCEKSDFEFDITPLETFEGDTQGEVDEKFNQYKRKYAEEFESDIFCARFYRHNLLSPWEQNREIRDFYTEKTEIIKRILDQNKEDARMGQKISKDRAEKGKAKDAKKLGKDPKSRKQYLQANPPTQLEQHGAVHMDKIDTHDIIKESSIPRDREEANSKEIEVGVHVIKPRISSRGSGKRRVRGFAEQYHFNIPSEELEKGQMQVQSPKEFQKKLLEQEQNL